MKVLIFGGSGKIGSAVAYDLAQDPEVEQIGIVGRHRNTLDQVKRKVGGRKLVAHVLDINRKKEVISLMKKYDVGVCVLPDRKTSYKVLQYSIEAGLNSVDTLEEFHRTPDLFEVEGLELPRGIKLTALGEWLHNKALESGVTFVDGMGFAPGISNVTCGQAIRKLDLAEKVVARVGGIPSKEAAARHPLRYMITWAFWHVLREYMIKLNVIQNGRVVEVDAGTGFEEFEFNQFGRNEKLACAITPGMPSFLFTRSYLKEFAEKTVRWPGHWEGVMTLKECGLLDIKPVDFKGRKIVPREFVSSIITPKLLPQKGETDVCVMYNTVEGLKNGRRTRIEYFMWDEADTKTGHSSMMRVTGFPIAITARLVAKGLIPQKGIVAPEDAIGSELYEPFMKELEKRNIQIMEIVTQI
jgi:saccharopine dehydrogenase-like NADP-dependent oxidoreductase